MPHIHLETTADLQENAQVPDILEDLATALSRCETVKPETVKAYHSLRSNWVVGEGHPEGIAHCTVSVLGGRSLEIKRKIVEALSDVLRRHFSQSLTAQEVGLTLEIRDMDPDTYTRLHVV